MTRHQTHLKLRWVWQLAIALLIALAVFSFGAPVLRATATNELFLQGLSLSRAGLMPEAVAAWTKAAQQSPAAGTYVNLGLAEWQRGHAGPAILAWERARWIDPHNGRAEQDLNFAREAAQVEAPALRWPEEISTWLRPDAWWWLAGGSLWAAVGLLVVPAVLGRKAGWQSWLAALAFGLCLFCATASWGVASRAKIGFVLKPDALVRLTPTANSEPVSTLAAGEPVRALRYRGGFVLVRALDGSGWVSQDAIGTICPP